MTANDWCVNESDDDWKQYKVSSNENTDGTELFFIPTKIAQSFKEIEEKKTLPLTCSCPRVGVRPAKVQGTPQAVAKEIDKEAVEHDEQEANKDNDTSKVYEAFEFDDEIDKNPASAKRKTPSSAVKRAKKEKASLSNVVNDIRRQKLLDDMEAAANTEKVAETPEQMKTRERIALRRVVSFVALLRFQAMGDYRCYLGYFTTLLLEVPRHGKLKAYLLVLNERPVQFFMISMTPLKTFAFNLEKTKWQLTQFMLTEKDVDRLHNFYSVCPRFLQRNSGIISWTTNLCSKLLSESKNALAEGILHRIKVSSRTDITAPQPCHLFSGEKEDRQLNDNLKKTILTERTENEKSALLASPKKRRKLSSGISHKEKEIFCQRLDDILEKMLTSDPMLQQLTETTSCAVEAKLEETSNTLSKQNVKDSSPDYDDDLTLPTRCTKKRHIHPIPQNRNKHPSKSLRPSLIMCSLSQKPSSSSLPNQEISRSSSSSIASETLLSVHKSSRPSVVVTSQDSSSQKPSIPANQKANQKLINSSFSSTTSETLSSLDASTKSSEATLSSSSPSSKITQPRTIGKHKFQIPSHPRYRFFTSKTKVTPAEEDKIDTSSNPSSIQTLYVEQTRFNNVENENSKDNDGNNTKQQDNTSEVLVCSSDEGSNNSDQETNILCHSFNKTFCPKVVVEDCRSPTNSGNQREKKMNRIQDATNSSMIVSLLDTVEELCQFTKRREKARRKSFKKLIKLRGELQQNYNDSSLCLSKRVNKSKADNNSTTSDDGRNSPTTQTTCEYKTDRSLVEVYDRVNKQFIKRLQNVEEVIVDESKNKLQYEKQKILQQYWKRVQRCDNCQRYGMLLMCEQCRSTFYCSKKCQIQDWNRKHSEKCSKTPDEFQF